MLRHGYSLCIALTLLATSGWAGQRVTSDYRDYQIRLSTWRPAGTVAAGVLVPVRINNGSVLRLVLDSGASDITISGNAARKLGLEMVAETQLSGFGEGRGTTAQIARADSVAVGDLQFGDCVVRVVQGNPARDADGIIGMKFFEAFRIRLDAGARELNLEAYADRGSDADTSADHLLFVKARVNGNDEGLFLVDTGSAVTSLASDVQWPCAMKGTTTNLSGVSGALPEARHLAPVWLEIGGRKLVERDPVVLNLEAISRRNGVKVAGILGYSVLSRTRVTFSYREGRVELGSR